MKGIVPPDPETNVSQVRFAVVYTKRQSRKRFPAGCVQIMATEEWRREEFNQRGAVT